VVENNNNLLEVEAYSDHKDREGKKDNEHHESLERVSQKIRESCRDFPQDCMSFTNETNGRTYGWNRD